MPEALRGQVKRVPQMRCSDGARAPTDRQLARLAGIYTETSVGIGVVGVVGGGVGGVGSGGDDVVGRGGVDGRGFSRGDGGGGGGGSGYKGKRARVEGPLKMPAHAFVGQVPRPPPFSISNYDRVITNKYSITIY